MQRIVLTLLLSFLPLILFAAKPVYLSGLLIQPSQSTSQFTFILSDKTYGHVKYHPHPARIEIELANTIKDFDMKKTLLHRANVQAIHVDESNKKLLRYIFYVNGESDWTVKFLPHSEQDGTRLQLTIFKINKSRISAVAKKPTHSHQLTKQVTTKQFVQTSQSNSALKNKRTFTVVIDAGHGGKDPGALGGRGAKEKDVVLSIAKRLANKINQLPHVKAILTRNGDYFVPLRKRLKLARAGKADLFVAIHADAYFENHATGASVYALSQHGASSEAARWLAQRDNYSELGGVELNSLTDHDPIVRSVLVDLAQTSTMQDSLRLGHNVLDALERITSLHHMQVERAPFVVLKSPDIPSILVETGFITNAKEEKRLTSAAYQEQLAHALSMGINQYVQKYAG